jgi:putative effector of murein hydrolase LrgA (UPF0299 family)
MIATLTLLLLCQLAGEAAARVAGLPVPGPVLGLVLLAAIFAWRGGVPDTVAGTATGLLQHLLLLYVPAGVGVMAHVARVEAEALALVVAILASTAATLAVTAAVFRLVSRWSGADDEPTAGPA